MRLIEITIIYLAAGAPFGAHRFLETDHEERPLLALVNAAATMFIWPFTALSLLAGRRRAMRRAEETRAGNERSIERLVKQLTDALYEMCEGARRNSANYSEEFERAAIVVRDHVEKYVCLTLAVEDSAASQPYRQELELYRVAGRTGKDLEVAGLCLHRRNSARLVEHRARARMELLHALADLREMATKDDEQRQGVSRSKKPVMSVALLKLYGQALNLFSFMRDEDAARGAARLIEAECVRLRRVESSASDGRPKRPDSEETCKPQEHPLAFTGPSQTGA